MENLDIAKVFYEIADLLEIKGDNPFRIRSYGNAGLVIEGLPVNIKSDALVKSLFCGSTSSPRTE